MSKYKILLETLFIYLKIVFTKNGIVLGPFHGEFGFEVSMNTSIAFSLKRKFNNNLIVVSLHGNQDLYKYCDGYIGFNYDLKYAGYGFGKIQDSLILRNEFKSQNNQFSNFIFIDLTRINIFLFKKLISFSFADLSEKKFQPNSSEVAIHFRTVLKSGMDTRANFSKENADTLVKELALQGFKINIIGHPNFSYCPKDFCIDCRSVNIGSALEYIQKSIVTIGQLSGPIHLAHLCKRPVITWADSPKRFETVKKWNPFNQTCLIVSENTFNPDILSIIQKLHDFKSR